MFMKLFFILILLMGAMFIGYTVLGDLSPEQTQATQPITLRPTLRP